MNKSLQNLIPFKKGAPSGNPNGRPRKFVSQLKMIGYKNNEINETIQNILSMTMEELELVFTDEKATILEKTVAGALKKSLTRGDLSSIETLLTRVYGKAKQEVDINTALPIQIIMPDKNDTNI
jgi:hypothetical protein